MSLAQVRALQSVMTRVHGFAEDVDLKLREHHDRLVIAAGSDEARRLVAEVRAALRDVDETLGRAEELLDAGAIARDAANELRERVAPLMRGILIETAQAPAREAS